MREARVPSLPADYLLHPTSADLVAPERVLVALDTNRGRVRVDVLRAMNERAANRFYTLVIARFFDGTKIASADANAVRFAPHARLDVRNVWYMRRLVPERENAPNERGTITLLAEGHSGRTTHVALNLARVADHDAHHATPFGRVRDMDVASRLRSGDVLLRARVVEETP